MSIESHLANEAKLKKPRRFKEVAGKLLNERESEDSRPWKWEEEITAGDWKEAEEKIMLEFADENKIHLWLLINMYLLEPNYQHHFPDELIKGLKKFIEVRKNVDDEGDVIIGSAVLRHLEGTREKLSDDERQEIRGVFPGGKNPREVIEHQLCLLLIDPLFFNKISEYSFKCLDDRIVTLRKKHQIDDRFDFFGLGLMLYKLLDIPYAPLSEKEWSDCISKFETEKNNIEDKFKIAAILRILAAHKVEFIDGGLVITDKPPQSLDTKLPPRPIRKKK